MQADLFSATPASRPGVILYFIEFGRRVELGEAADLMEAHALADQWTAEVRRCGQITRRDGSRVFAPVNVLILIE